MGVADTAVIRQWLDTVSPGYEVSFSRVVQKEIVPTTGYSRE